MGESGCLTPKKKPLPLTEGDDLNPVLGIALNPATSPRRTDLKRDRRRRLEAADATLERSTPVKEAALDKVELLDGLEVLCGTARSSRGLGDQLTDPDGACDGEDEGKKSAQEQGGHDQSLGWNR